MESSQIPGFYPLFAPPEGPHSTFMGMQILENFSEYKNVKPINFQKKFKPHRMHLIISKCALTVDNSLDIADFIILVINL